MSDLNTQLLNEAIRIGEDLIQRSKTNEKGRYWECMSMDPDKNISWEISESIYSGTAGVLLFFIELYKHTNDERYKDVVLKSADWLEDHCSSNQTDYYAFYTGRMSVAYTFIELAKFTGDKSYHDKAMTIAEGVEGFLNRDMAVDDLINGKSGTLLGLLHLYAATQDDKLLGVMIKYIDHLISSAHLGPVGVYWDRSRNNIRGLCGFSHGAAGIGYVFLELGNYFQNEGFKWLAEQAFAYENYYFNEQANNWPDFRNGVYTEEGYEEHKNAFLNKDLDFFTQPSDMAAWCHGAPGIGLARLRAFQLYGNDDMLKETRMAIEKIRRVNVSKDRIAQSYTLCHGAGGNLMLLLDTYKQTKDQRLLDDALQVGGMALEYKSTGAGYVSGFSQAGQTEDISLFMGNAGIGYFLLNLIDPINTPSILKPELNDQFNGDIPTEINISLKEVQHRLISNVYPRSAQLLSQLKPDDTWMFSKDSGLKQSFTEAVRELIEDPNNSALKDAFHYENEKALLDDKMPANCYTYIKNNVEITANHSLLENKSDTELMKTRIALNGGSALVETSYDWVNGGTNNGEEAHYAMFMATADGVEEHALNDFAYMVLNNFAEAQEVDTVVKDVLDAFEFENEEEQQMIMSHILQQVKEGLRIGVLVEAE
ncbi:MAG: lanthionine synthetase LanC family protein [Bacteroidota bacterium]